MTHKQHQNLLAELNELRQRNQAMTLGDRVQPIETFSGTVHGGPALLVENESDEPHSTGIEARVGKGMATARNFAVSATADEISGVGVIGRGSYGMVGQSPDNVGVMGFGTTGVFGLSNDPDGHGVEGHASSTSGIGVLASAPSADATALAINNGSIRILDAGLNTPTPVFIHMSTEENTRGTQTVLDHPMTNGDSRAILLVTRRGENIVGDSGRPAPATGNPIADVSVAYNFVSERWMLVQQGDKPMAVGSSFNVLVFKV